VRTIALREENVKIAVDCGKMDILKYVVENGAKSFSRAQYCVFHNKHQFNNSSNRCLLYRCVYVGNYEMTKYLLEIRNNYFDKNDEDLVKLSLKDADVFSIIIDRYREKLFLYIKRISNVSKEEAEDLLQEMKLPLGYHVELIGESKEIKDSQQNILIASIVAVIIVFFLLYATFNSWRLAIITFITIPTGLTGGVFAVYLFDGGILSLGSLVGFLTVLGVATRNGIMLISHYQNLEYKEGQSFGPELIIRGAGERITPILMTTFTTGLALVPIMIAGKVAGHEIEYPMAIVIIGGLITSTLLNIFIVPALYYWFGKKKNDAK
jgi:predicted RND superfamily exporter protein